MDLELAELSEISPYEHENRFGIFCLVGLDQLNQAEE
jgi:hypothetical protein